MHLFAAVDTENQTKQATNQGLDCQLVNACALSNQDLMNVVVLLPSRFCFSGTLVALLDLEDPLCVCVCVCVCKSVRFFLEPVFSLMETLTSTGHSRWP